MHTGHINSTLQAQKLIIIKRQWHCMVQPYLLFCTIVTETSTAPPGGI